MSSLIIDDKGTQFFYIDSGRPQRQVYTTVVIVHGHTFHSGIFKRLLPLATSRGLRVICPHRRDYVGTTSYSPSELDVLSTGSKEKQAAFLNARGIEVALFLNRLIEEHALPKPTADRKDGGLALMGWSLGVVEPIAAVASVASLPSIVRHRLQAYLRKLILHDPPSLALGILGPPKQYFPLFDESLPPAERGNAFGFWVSGYFKHGDMSKRNPDVLVYRTPDPSRKPTIVSIPPQEMPSLIDTAPAQRSEAYLITRFGAALERQMEKVLLNETPGESWPILDIWLMHGDKSPWMVIYSAWEVENRSDGAIKTLIVEDANHFVFWDDCSKGLEALLYCLRN